MSRRYYLLVGNLGCVYEGTCPIQANAAWGEYKRQSMSNYGRAAGEDVTLFRNGELIREYVGTRDET